MLAPLIGQIDSIRAAVMAISTAMRRAAAEAAEALDQSARSEACSRSRFFFSQSDAAVCCECAEISSVQSIEGCVTVQVETVLKQTPMVQFKLVVDRSLLQQRASRSDGRWANELCQLLDRQPLVHTIHDGHAAKLEHAYVHKGMTCNNGFKSAVSLPLSLHSYT
eukprot:SAG31_NODE_2780_length_5098_cov_2.124000_6_plen_165_part_00